MPDWQERIDRGTRPAIRAEHELRYAAAAPIVRASDTWIDLGCGNGLAAAAGIGDTYEGCAVLVDVDADAVELAAQTVAAREVVALTADLAVAEGVERVREQVAAGGENATVCITCFETIEHLASFVPLVELLAELAEEAACTVVLSVPNDAFFGVENPHHATMWSEAAVEELRGLLPAEHRRVQQVMLQGSALVEAGEDTQEVAMVSATADVPTHELLAFGPLAGDLAITSRIVQTDLDEQRRWERQRESDLAFHVAQAREAEAAAGVLRARVRELERRLAPPAAPPGAESAAGGEA